jgi:ribosomal protein S18 acetylase RimI-like enzyme
MFLEPINDTSSMVHRRSSLAPQRHHPVDCPDFTHDGPRQRARLRSAAEHLVRDDTAMAGSSLTIRPAARPDLPALGRLGAELVRQHFGFDAKRFMAPVGRLEDGYAWFLGSQLDNTSATVLVAEQSGRILGYVYAAIEPQSWEELREEAGYIHDIIVDDPVRGRGVGSALIDAAIAWFRGRGMPRVLLTTAEQNTPAQRLFARLGFRRTMIEMTREIE